MGNSSTHLTLVQYSHKYATEKILIKYSDDNVPTHDLIILIF